MFSIHGYLKTCFLYRALADTGIPERCGGRSAVRTSVKRDLKETSNMEVMRPIDTGVPELCLADWRKRQILDESFV
jgi:hypothetical protein